MKINETMKKLNSGKGLQLSGLSIIVVILGLTMLAPVVAQEETTEATTIRPIEDFVDQQGTYCIDDGSGGCFQFFPPVNNYIAWSDNSNLDLVTKLALVDYAGIANNYIVSQGGNSLNTKTYGGISEREISTGREVTVQLYTTNALTFVAKVLRDDEGNITSDFNSWPLLFGYRAAELDPLKPTVLNGAKAALGESFLKVVFTDTKSIGDPMPDLVQLANFPEPGQNLKYISFNAKANGELRADFGVSDGTLGQLNVVQRGLFDPGSKGSPVLDAFPAERVDLNVVGK